LGDGEFGLDKVAIMGIKGRDRVFDEYEEWKLRRVGMKVTGLNTTVSPPLSIRCGHVFAL